VVAPGISEQIDRPLIANVGEAPAADMAENLIWLATQLYPDRKIIVWAHNNHIMTDKWMLYDAHGPEVAAVIGQESTESIGRRTYLGEAVRAYFGDRATYALGLITGTGEYSTDIAPALYGRAADFNKTESLASAGPGTLEAAPAASGHRVAFVDMPSRDTGPVSTRVIDYSELPPLPLNIAQGFDGLLCIDTTHRLETISPAAR
jgi:erythromycin esterase-like protein